MVLPPSKDSDVFTVHQKDPLNAEPDADTLIDSGWKTQKKHGYLRNHGDVLHLDRKGYQLSIDIEDSLRPLLDPTANLAKNCSGGSIDLDTILRCGKVNLAAALQVC